MVYADSTMALSVKKRYWLAAAEVTAINVGVHLFDRFALNADFAQTTLNTLKRNFSDGMASVFMYDDGTMGFINKRGEQVIPPSNRFEGATPFSEGRAFALKDGKYALIDNEGNELTPFLFDDISLYEGTEGEEPIIGMFHEGLAAVAKNGKFGYIDRDGNTVIPFRYKPGYDEDNEWYNQQAAYDFHEGVARVWSSRTKKYGFIDKEGNEITPCRFDEASDMSGGLALVQIGEDYGFIDKEGNCTLDLDE